MMKPKTFPVLLFLVLIFNRAAADSLKVVTINVWSGLDYIGSLKMGEYESAEIRERRYQILLQQLRELDPDVIALNEANKLPRYARRIARDLNVDQLHHLGVAGIHIGPLGLPVNLREGDVILAKKDLNLQSAGRRQLSGGHVGRFFTFHFADATQVIGATIEFAGQTIYLFNTHWHASRYANRATLEKITQQYLEGEIGDDQYLNIVTDAVEGKKWRLGEARRTIEFINKTAGQNPAILMGDFNDLFYSDPIRMLRESGFIDSYSQVNREPGPTWDERLNRNIRLHYLTEIPSPENARRDRIDYIFFRGQPLKVRRSEVVLNKVADNLHPSDHFGVMTIFEIGNQP